MCTHIWHAKRADAPRGMQLLFLALYYSYTAAQWCSTVLVYSHAGFQSYDVCSGHVFKATDLVSIKCCVASVTAFTNRSQNDLRRIISPPNFTNTEVAGTISQDVFGFSARVQVPVQTL